MHRTAAEHLLAAAALPVALPRAHYPALPSSRRGEVIEDGPSSTLLQFMKESQFVAPADWKGFRELTEK